MRQQKSRRHDRKAPDSPSKEPQEEPQAEAPADSETDPVKDPVTDPVTDLESARRERDAARADLAAARREISELQETLEAARARQKAGDDTFRQFSESGLMGIGVFDLDGRLEYANEALLTMMGRTAPEIAGLRWIDLVVPEAADLVKASFEELRRQGGCSPFEAEYVRPDGNRFWALFFGVLFGPDRAAAFVLDITRRHVLEDETAALNQELQQRVTELQRLASIVESSQDSILTKTLDGIITDWNRAAERLYGYLREEIIGRPVSVLAPPGMQREMDLILEHIRRGERVETRETQRLTKDGRCIDVAVTVSPLRDTDGELVGASSIARDITRQKQLQRELQERNEQIETQAEELEAQFEELQVQHEELGRQDRQRNEFLAMLAHELRNPLAPILAATEVMRLRGLHDPMLDRQRNIIARQVRHLVRLVDDLLDVARIVQGKVALRRETVDLAEVLDHALQISSAFIDERGHRLTVSLPPGALWVEGDATRLVQVVCNLLNNAARYTEPGGQIWLSLDAGPSIPAERRAAHPGTAIIRVRDTGRGIPPQLLSSIFDIFVQADRNLDRSEGGLGVGLTLARSLVEQHSGTITALSEGPQRGSEFIVQLPSLSATPTADGNHEIAGRSGTGRRIVVVDDNTDALETLAELLSLNGHSVWTASSGPEALSLAEEHSPDVLLVDLGMPGMDGIEVARCVLSNAALRDIPMIAVTGYGNDTDRHASREAGFRFHLTKPVDLETLREVLQQL